MTKEELKKEAEEYANNLTFVFETDIVQRIVRERVRLALIDVLEPREKQIAELEAQIEKMKCGQNCKHSYLYQEDRKCKFTYCDCVNCKEKWELRR